MSYSRWLNSDWYIFSSGDGTLSIWHAGEDKVPSFTYEEVKRMYEEDDWAELFDNNDISAMTEKSVLIASVEAWFEDESKKNENDNFSTN